MNNYKFSVIIPIYNSEHFLKKAINSVLKQTIGFKKNIQLILINDGSKDNSDKICSEFAKKYPQNVIYKYQENSGVSSARNLGLSCAEGDYVSFLDSDDFFSKNVFKDANSYFEKHPDIKLLSFKMVLFGKTTVKHALDFKYKQSTICDLKKNPNFVQSTVTNVIFKKHLLKNKKFDNKLEISEDLFFVSSILLSEMKYGVLNSSFYYYRKRKDNTSTIQNVLYKKSYFTITPKHCYGELIDLSIKKYNQVIPYIMYTIAYDMQYRITKKKPTILSPDEFDTYVKDIIYLLKNINNDILSRQERISLPYRFYCYNLKYGNLNMQKMNINNNKVYFDDILFCDTKDFTNYIDIFECDGEKLIIEGNLGWINKKEIYIKANNNEMQKIKCFPRIDKVASYPLDEKIQTYGYKVCLDIKNINTIDFFIKHDGKYYKCKLDFTSFANLSGLKNAYYFSNKFIFYVKDTSIIINEKDNFFQVFKKEVTYLFTILFFYKKTKIFIYRILSWLVKLFCLKDIWLISDRDYIAGDNGEALFKYMSNLKSRKEKAYFVINKDCKDYARMKKFGSVIDRQSLFFKLLVLNSSYLISSQSSIGYLNPFGDARLFYADLFKTRNVYLTHGVGLNDLSGWLNKYEKNIKVFIASCPEEVNKLLKAYPYYYDEEIKLTGMPRNDSLIDCSKKYNQILFMPSWRASIAGKQLNASTDIRAYNPNFKDSEYYQFYYKLTNHPKLLRILHDNNLKVVYYIHPCFYSQRNDFVGNEYVTFISDGNIQDELRKSKLLVTDFSSLGCDFAYMKKPIVYANFDIDKVFSNHSMKSGFFNYDDGFGPNCKTVEQVIDELEKIIKNDFKIDKRYLKKVNSFFKYTDRNNCKRVYNAIKKDNDLRRK